MPKCDWWKLSKASSNGSWTKFSGSWLCGHHPLPQKQPGKANVTSHVQKAEWPSRVAEWPYWLGATEGQLEFFQSMTVYLVCWETRSRTCTSSIKSCNQNLLQDKHDQQKPAQATTTHLWMDSRPPLKICYWRDTQNLGKISCNSRHPQWSCDWKQHLHSKLKLSGSALSLFSQQLYTGQVTRFYLVQKERVILFVTLLSRGTYHCCSSLSAVLSKSHSYFFSRRMTPTEVLVTWDEFRDT